MTALATPDQLGNRIGEIIESSEDLMLAQEMLESASNWVRFYSGQDGWNAINAPALAVSITIAAAARGYLNPAGYLEERADVNFVKRAPGWANEAKLFPDEIEVLRTFNQDTTSNNSLNSARISDPDRLIPRSMYAARHWERFGWTPPPPLDLSEWN